MTQMPADLTAPQVREVMEALTGTKIPGVIERLVHPAGGFAYRIRYARAMLICTREDGEWIVWASDGSGLVGVWRNAEGEAARNGARLIDEVLGLSGEERAVFLRQYIHASPEVHRKSYRTGRGEVWLHTRVNERGTEGAIQLPDGKVLRYQWERQSGQTFLDEEPVGGVPF